MVTCQVSCPIYSTCKDRAEWKRCVYDYGIKTDKNENKDDFLERLTY